jgi:nucleoside-diphosphate-sugar epimerase
MKVLFIGGTGKISRAVSRLAVQKGLDLYLLNRGQHDAKFAELPHGINYIQADIRDFEKVDQLLKTHQFDVVVEWIGYNIEQVENDIRLFGGKIEQYIFISTASVYQRPLNHYLVNESTPLNNPYWDYSQKKIACEARLLHEYRKNGFPVTIVRPSLTYGDGMAPFAVSSSEHPWTIIDRMMRNKEIIVHGDGTSLWTMTHNTDFAKGILGLFDNIPAIGHAFHITSDEVLNWNQIAEIIGRAAGVKPKIIHIPSEFICQFAPEFTGTLFGDKAASVVYDNSKIKKFNPDFLADVTFYEGMKKSIKWFESNPSQCTVDHRIDQLMDRIIDAYRKGLVLCMEDR